MDKPVIVPNKKQFNIVLEFDENSSQDDIHRSVAQLMNIPGVKGISFDYVDQCKNKILISLMDHLETLKREDF